MSLHDHGWNEFFANQWEAFEKEGLQPARVVSSSSGLVRLITDQGERLGVLAGRLRLQGGGVPVAGDWVAVRVAEGATPRVEALLERRTRLSRKAAGRRTDEQVVAANIDLVLVVMGLDGDFSLRRLERLMALIEQSGASGAVFLNKRDLCDDAAVRMESVRRTARGASVLMGSCLLDDGLEAVRACLPTGRTGALVGSSGAGKSTLINRLLGRSVQATAAVRRADGRGRHTTTRRELFLLPGGGMIIDNPGIREVQLWGDEEGLGRAFDDVTSLAAACRYRDCRHDTEPGCAVDDAVKTGRLDPGRLHSYRALVSELRYLELRQDGAAQREQKRKWRAIHRSIKRSRRNH